MTRVLISVDPGIDRSAAVIWHFPETDLVVSSDVAILARHVIAVRQCETLTTDTTPNRLAHLALWARLLSGMALHEPPGTRNVPDVWAVVEDPAFAGMYRGRTPQRSKLVQPNADAMAKLHKAIGAIIAGLGQLLVREAILLVPAAKVAREQKQLIGRGILAEAAGRMQVANNDDTRSAAYIGVHHLLSQRPVLAALPAEAP